MKETVKVSNTARNHVRDLLRNKKEIEKEIASLEEAIMNPFRASSDENTGGGRSSFKSFETENKAIKIVSHEQIIFRSQFLRIAEKVLSQSSDEAQRIIELRYFIDEPYSWVKIASIDNIGYTEDGCRKVDRAICDKIAKILGW